MLSGYYRNWDSVLTSNPIPAPWLSDEDDYEITFKKRDWGKFENGGIGSRRNVWKIILFLIEKALLCDDSAMT